jgi:hypothetical protein
MIWAAAFGLVGLFVAVVIAMNHLQHRPKRPARDPEWARTRRYALLGVLSIVAGTMVWRIRSADDLASNPLDSAGIVRIFFDVLGVALSLHAWDRLGRSKNRKPVAHWSPAFLYGVYVVIILAGMYPAVKPLLVGFRAFELSVMPLSVLVAARCFDLDECITIVKRILYVMTASIAASVALFPSEALTRVGGGLYGYRVQGVLPAIAYNSVGTIGLILIAIGAGRRRLELVPMIIGFALIVFSQYRTGFIGMGAMLAVWLIVRWRVVGAVVLGALAIPAYVIASSAAVATLWARGSNVAQVDDLNGRTEFWAQAFHVAERSPIIGVGLTSGTRYEVLDTINGGLISTIHSTWVEAYLGTGILGLAVVATLLLQFCINSWRVREHTLAPLLFAAGIAVRSITGTTYELAGKTAVIFALLAYAVWLEVHEPQREDQIATPRLQPVTSSGR